MRSSSTDGTVPLSVDQEMTLLSADVQYKISVNSKLFFHYTELSSTSQETRD